MHWDQIDLYTKEVCEAQEEFDGKIKILLGYEVDYLPVVDDQMRANLAKYPADYWVGSIHIVDQFRSDHESWLVDFSPAVFEEGMGEMGGAQAVYTRYYESLSANSPGNTTTGLSATWT